METNNQTSVSQPNFWVVFICCLFLGIFGVHRFIVKKTKSGIIQLLTCGGFGYWVLIDLILILCGRFKNSDGNVIPNPNPKLCALAVFVIIFVILGVGLMVSKTVPETAPEIASGNAKITRSELEQKLQQKFGAIIIDQNMIPPTGIINGWEVQEFEQIAGKPDDITTTGDGTFYGYDCSDGRIVFELNSSVLAAGRMQGKVREFSTEDLKEMHKLENDILKHIK